MDQNALKDFLESAKNAQKIDASTYNNLLTFLKEYNSDPTGQDNGATALVGFMWYFGAVIILSALALMVISIGDQHGLVPAGMFGAALSAAIWWSAEKQIGPRGLRLLSSLLVMVSVLGLSLSSIALIIEWDVKERILFYCLSLQLIILGLIALKRTGFLFFTVPITLSLWMLGFLLVSEFAEPTRDGKYWLAFLFAWITLIAGWAFTLLGMRFAHVMYWSRKLALILLAYGIGMGFGSTNGLFSDPVVGWHTVILSSMALAAISWYCHQNDGYAVAFLGLFSFVLNELSYFYDGSPIATSLAAILIGYAILHAGIWLYQSDEKIGKTIPSSLRKIRPKAFKEPISYLF